MAAVLDLHEARLLEPLQRFAQRAAIDPEHLAELALGRERRAWLEPPVDDAGAELLEDRVGEGATLDGGDFEGRRHERGNVARRGPVVKW